MEHNFKALKIAEESGNKTTIVHLLNAIGSVYKYKGDYPQALEYYFKALKIHEDFGIKRDLSITYGDICEVYYHQKKYTAAIEYGQQALKTADELGGDYTRAWALLDLGRAYLTIAEDTSAVSAAGMRQYGLTASRAAMLQSAIAYLQRGLPISKEVHSVRTMRYFYENIAQAYRLSGDYKKALAYSDTFRAIRDSVFSKENEQKILSREYESKRLEDSLRTADEKNIAGLKLEHQRSYTYLGFAVILLLLGFSFFIVREHRKSEKLLLNILPSKVAAELKSQGVSKARLFDNVTVLFTDFVNFTQAGESMSPEALIGELDICFKAFDEIIEKYNIEKIKTIGDAYLAVSGLPIPDPGHAGNIVKAAIEISKFMEDRQAMQGGKAFRVRIGIHSGSVVAGIVGVKKFAYDIWGDTVNTAARMEQSSEPGRINISQTTYELIKDKFTCVYRGEVEVKNKGKLKMYFIA